MSMEIASTAAAAVSLSQGRARQDLAISGLEREAQNQQAVAGVVEEAARTGAGSGAGSGNVTPDRGQNLNISV